MTDRIRDEDLASLIAWAEVSNDLVLRALLELRERREQDHETDRAAFK